MSDFPWYSEIVKSSDLTQGDLLPNCPIPFPNREMFLAVLQDQATVDEPMEVKNANLVILSQACDLANDKLDTVVLCPYWPLKKLMESNEYYAGSKGRESLRQGKEPAYHLLNKYRSQELELDYSVVDFHRIYTLPKDYLHEFTANLPRRIRLLPPYREHLSQAFARYFMRVGLPVDIDRNEIKNIS